MKKIILSAIIVFTACSSVAQIPKTPKETASAQNTNAANYRLFPTQNMWTFIKLNARNGQLWQVQYDIKGNSRFETNINSEPLIPKENEVSDRFILYPTQNIYTFLLLDQHEGKLWQVQWSLDASNRGIIPFE